MVNLKNWFFLLLGLILVSCSNNKGQQFDLESEALQDAVAQVNKRLEDRNELLYCTYSDDNKKLKVPFKIKNQNTLIFKSSITNCESCFDSVMTLLIKENWEEKVDLEIWIDNPRFDKMLDSKFWYSKKLKIVFRHIDGSLLSALKSEKVNKPFFFIFNKQHQSVSNLFFPELGDNENTRKYLDIVLERYPKLML